MSKRSLAIEQLPSAVQAQLAQLGQHLALARQRRRESRRAWAQRMGVSEPTLTRLEAGDPSVSMAAYASALWLMGRSQVLADLAAPQHDLGALEAEVRAASRQRVRAPQSQP